MTNIKRITYAELGGWLAGLGFVEESVSFSHRAFRHRASGTLIVLAYYDDPDTAVREEDVISVHRHLEEKGLADARALERLGSR